MEAMGEIPEEPPKKDKSGEAPVPQKPPEAPSENSKSSSTDQLPSWESVAAELTGGITEDPAAAPDFKSTAAVVYEENRVKVADYGGALFGEAADKLLESVEVGVKLHKLAAKRYRAFKTAAIAEGFKNFKIKFFTIINRYRMPLNYRPVINPFIRYSSANDNISICFYRNTHFKYCVFKEA